jgi:hypothetical protein
MVCDAGGLLKHAYFPQGSVLSLLTVLENGAAIETANIGREGALKPVEVSDQGAGLPEGFDIEQPRASLGFKVITGMVRQLQGHLTTAMIGGALASCSICLSCTNRMDRNPLAGHSTAYSSPIERPQDASEWLETGNRMVAPFRCPENWTVRLRCKPNSCTLLGIFLSRPFHAG